MGFIDKLKHAWDAFTNEEKRLESRDPYPSYGSSFGIRPYRNRLSGSNERSILSAVITRMAIDAASNNIEHADLDENKRYLGSRNSYLNECLTVEANIDQTALAFKIDMIMSLFDKGVIAVVPVETTLNPLETSGYDVKNLRVGEVVAWYPRHVRVSIYNDRLGRREELTLPKEIVAIVENPLYSVMNEPNSTLQRLIRKLNLLDAIDEQSGSGKLDIIIQLPYVVKSDTRRKQAEDRRRDLELQLQGSKYGIGYTDATERITQLNRPAENNMLGQIQYLTTMLYSQLGITEDVFNGTANEATMLNYYSRTIEPVLTAVVESLNRTFLTKTARTQRQAIVFYRDPFKLVPIANLAEFADKFTRNEILTSNEVRGIIGFKPINDPKADILNNPNVPQRGGLVDTDESSSVESESERDKLVEDTLSSLESMADKIISDSES